MSLELNADHKKALRYVKLAICSTEFDAFSECQYSSQKKDCSELQETMLKCTDANDFTAHFQLQYNAKVHCPKQFNVFVKCLDDNNGTYAKRCEPLWVAMQNCAAKNVMDHLDAQRKRTDGGYTQFDMIVPTVSGRG